jgi:hypothetical protein
MQINTKQSLSLLVAVAAHINRLARKLLVSIEKVKYKHR